MLHPDSTVALCCSHQITEDDPCPQAAVGTLRWIAPEDRACGAIGEFEPFVKRIAVCEACRLELLRRNDFDPPRLLEGDVEP